MLAYTEPEIELAREIMCEQLGGTETNRRFARHAAGLHAEHVDFCLQLARCVLRRAGTGSP
jgi:hypothetical protein